MNDDNKKICMAKTPEAKSKKKRKKKIMAENICNICY